MAVELATAYVQIVPSAQGLQGAIASQLGGPSAAAGATAGGAFAGNFKKVAKVGITGLGVTAAVNVGRDFDQAFDTIRVGTGATGDALTGLQDSFRNVARNVPADFADIGTAIADVNTRLGLTGEPLEAVSAQILELSRITGTDVAGNVESLSRTLGDAGIASEDTADAIDALFRASQATGPSVARLGDLAVQYGAPLRNFGFSFEESAALLGKFEQEGVNTELVMGSLRIALGKFAKAGEDPVEALGASVDAIQNAGSAAEANALAFDIFGARAGADMAAAIREGRFEIDDLFDTVANGEETIGTAAEDTKSLGEQFTLLKNQALVGLQPAATKLFDSLGNGLEAVIPAVSIMVDALVPLIDLFAMLPGPVLAGGLGLLSFALIGAKLVSFGKTVVTAIGAVSKAFTLLAANPWTLVIIAAVAAVFIIVKYWDEISAALVAAWEWVSGVASSVWNGITAIVETAGSLVSSYIQTFYIGPVEALIGFFEKLPAIASTAWNAVLAAVDAVKGAIVAGINEIKAAADAALGPLDEIVGAAGGFISRGAGLLGFDDGGVVPGPIGAPRLALVHGGETIFPTHKTPMAQLAPAVGVGAGGGQVYNDFRGLTVRDDADLKAITRAVNRQKAAQGTGSVNGGLNW